MPQDGSSNYYYPPGTLGVPDQTIESEAYNTFLDDLVINDLNIPRPIHRGGTGANTAAGAMAALGGELAGQLVSNFDSHIWFPGSFRSATTATGSPIPGSAFAGWVYTSDVPQDPPLNQNIVVHAYDISVTPRPGMLYTKEKRAGVWSAWTVETNISVGPTPPTDMRAGALYWDNDNGVLYVNYNDGDTTQWVQAVALPAIDTTMFVQRGGDTMTGPLTLAADPTVPLHSATKQYVDARSAQTISLAGSPSFDVAVPTGTRAARISGIIVPTSAVGMDIYIRLSVTAGVFRSTAGDYQLNGGAHFTGYTNTNIVPQVGVGSLPGMYVADHGHSGLPIFLDGLLLLKRANTTTTLFSGDFHAAGFYTTGSSHFFYNNFMTTAASGSALQVLAFRLLGDGSDSWDTDSVLRVEWL